LVRPLERHDFAIDFFFTHASRDELGHLRTEIDDENFVVAGEPIGIGAAHEGGIEDGHPDLMCGARPVRSRPVFAPEKLAVSRALSSSSRLQGRAIRQDPLPTARSGHLNLSFAFCTRCRAFRFLGSFAARRWLWSLCWYCIDRGGCASGPYPPIRSNISERSPWGTRHFRSPWALSRGWEPARPRPERRRSHRGHTEPCGNRANSAR